jgi:putative SOS response-associated peptidase YedK
MAPNLEPQNDINPADPAPIFRMRAEGDGLEMVTARWWFVPDTWHGTFKEFGKPKRSDGSRGYTTFNARSEGAAQSSTFRKAMGSQRCLVPADGWYEWTGEKYPKTKWLFEREDADWFCFAGLWSRFESSDQGPLETFTLLTMDSAEHLARYHDRRPIALPRSGWEAWLDEAVLDVMPAAEVKDAMNSRRSVRWRLAARSPSRIIWKSSTQKSGFP